MQPPAWRYTTEQGLELVAGNSAIATLGKGYARVGKGLYLPLSGADDAASGTTHAITLDDDGALYYHDDRSVDYRRIQKAMGDESLAPASVDLVRGFVARAPREDGGGRTRDEAPHTTHTKGALLFDDDASLQSVQVLKELREDVDMHLLRLEYLDSLKKRREQYLMAWLVTTVREVQKTKIQRRVDRLLLLKVPAADQTHTFHAFDTSRYPDGTRVVYADDARDGKREYQWEVRGEAIYQSSITSLTLRARTRFLEWLRNFVATYSANPGGGGAGAAGAAGDGDAGDEPAWLTAAGEALQTTNDNKVLSSNEWIQIEQLIQAHADLQARYKELQDMLKNEAPVPTSATDARLVIKAGKSYTTHAPLRAALLWALGPLAAVTRAAAAADPGRRDR